MEESGACRSAERGPGALSRGKCYRDGPAGSRLLVKGAMKSAAGELLGDARRTCLESGPEEEEEYEDDDEEQEGGRGDSSPDAECPSPAGSHFETVRFDDDDQLRVKRARVECAVGGLLPPPGRLSPPRRAGRRDSELGLPRHLGPTAAAAAARREGREEERRRLKRQLEAMKRQLQQLQGKIGRAYAGGRAPGAGPAGRRAASQPGGRPPGDKELAQALKEELNSAVAQVVDTVVKLFSPRPCCQAPPALLQASRPRAGDGDDPSRRCPLRHPGEGPPAAPQAQLEALPLVVRKCSPGGPAGRAGGLAPVPVPRPGAPALLRSGYPHPLPWQLMAYAVPGPLAASQRTPPEAFRELLGLRTKVSAHPMAQPPCSPRHPHGSAEGLPVTKTENLDLQEGPDVQVYGAGADGLCPAHLKKAKLIFLYSRYPSSNTLKTYFPDVKFNRCITSQLIKWFSNFREFFYIQVEKFARQALSEGVSGSEQLAVNRDSDLFRTLNQHYNKSSEFEVPDKFLEVSQTTLQEFFDAIAKGRDSDPSWKKPIYKVISKLDNDIPDLFKSPGSL